MNAIIEKILSLIGDIAQSAEINIVAHSERSLVDVGKSVSDATSAPTEAEKAAARAALIGRARIYEAIPKDHGISNDGDIETYRAIGRLARTEITGKADQGIALAQLASTTARELAGLYLSGGLTGPVALVKGLKVWGDLQKFAPKSIPTVDAEVLAQLVAAYEAAKNPPVPEPEPEA